MHSKRESDLTPAERVGGDVGWTVALPSGRHYGATREVVAAIHPDIPEAEQNRIRGMAVNSPSRRSHVSSRG